MQGLTSSSNCSWEYSLIPSRHVLLSFVHSLHRLHSFHTCIHCIAGGLSREATESERSQIPLISRGVMRVKYWIDESLDFYSYEMKI